MSRDTARSSSNQQIFYCVAVHEIPEGSTKKKEKKRKERTKSATIQILEMSQTEFLHTCKYVGNCKVSDLSLGRAPKKSKGHSLFFTKKNMKSVKNWCTFILNTYLMTLV